MSSAVSYLTHNGHLGAHCLSFRLLASSSSTVRGKSHCPVPQYYLSQKASHSSSLGCRFCTGFVDFSEVKQAVHLARLPAPRSLRPPLLHRHPDTTRHPDDPVLGSCQSTANTVIALQPSCLRRLHHQPRHERYAKNHLCQVIQATPKPHSTFLYRRRSHCGAHPFCHSNQSSQVQRINTRRQKLQSSA